MREKRDWFFKAFFVNIKRISVCSSFLKFDILMPVSLRATHPPHISEKMNGDRIINVVAFVVLCAAVYYGIQYSGMAKTAGDKIEMINQKLTQVEQGSDRISEQTDGLRIDSLKEEKEDLEDQITLLKEDLGLAGEKKDEEEQDEANEAEEEDNSNID